MNSTTETSGCLDIGESITSVEFGAEKELFQATFDSTRGSVSLAVITVIAAARDTDPLDLAPLQSAIDTASLDNLCSGPVNGVRKYDRISFKYEGFEVTIFNEGRIEAVPTEKT